MLFDYRDPAFDEHTRRCLIGQLECRQLSGQSRVKVESPDGSRSLLDMAHGERGRHSGSLFLKIYEWVITDRFAFINSPDLDYGVGELKETERGAVKLINRWVIQRRQKRKFIHR